MVQTEDKIFVLADDGLIYESPVLKGRAGGGWLLEFVGGGPAVLRMGVPRDVPDDTAALLAESLLANAGIAARVVGGPKWPRAGKPEFDVEVLAPVPARHIPPGGPRGHQPAGAGYFYDFGRPWG
jgi:hypothetical protein